MASSRLCDGWSQRSVDGTIRWGAQLADAGPRNGVQDGKELRSCVPKTAQDGFKSIVPWTNLRKLMLQGLVLLIIFPGLFARLRAQDFKLASTAFDLPS